MRMKKIMILAVAAIALAACSKTYDNTPVAQSQIGFNTWAETLTKARTQGSSTFASGDDFAVYGYKDKSDDSDPQTVFGHDGTNDVVVSTTDGTTWDYTTPRYWDSNYDKYIFYAISPSAVGLAGSVNPQTGAITSAAISFSGKNNDILVADKKQVDKGSAPYFNNYAIVPLVFNHVASLVDFKVKKTHGLADATVTVTAFELSDIDSQGQLTVSSAYTGTHPVASWTDPGTARSTYGPADGVESVTLGSGIAIAEDTAFNPASPATPAAATDIIKKLVVMPQTFRASGGTNPQKITLTYKIAIANTADVEYKDCVVYLNQFDVENDDYNSTATNFTGWEPGKHYTFYITLDAHKINFSATITDWTNVSGYNYLLN